MKLVLFQALLLSSLPFGETVAVYNANLNLHEFGIWDAHPVCKPSVDGWVCRAQSQEYAEIVLRCPGDRAPAWCTVRLRERK